MEKTIAVSILNCNDIPSFLRWIKMMDEKIHQMKFCDQFFKIIIHFDVMDQQFVPHAGVNLKYIQTAKNLGFETDTHLMVQKPIGDTFIDKAIQYGTDSVTIHFEIDHFENIIAVLNAKKQELKKYHGRELSIGVSVKPNTDITKLEKYKDQFSKLLVMSVEPGLGGQAYIDAINEKLKKARKLFPQHTIQVDGGINDATMMLPLRYGVDSLVIGSFLTSSSSEEVLYQKFMECNLIKMIEALEKDANTEFQQKILQIVPGGYGEKDHLLGITVPSLRKLASQWYPHISFASLEKILISDYHEYRQIAIFLLSNMMKKAYEKEEKEIVEQVYVFFKKHLQAVNNWDLTDEAGPNIVAYYLLTLSEEEQRKELYQYIFHENTWIKRIGIVSMLTFVRKNDINLPFEICDSVIYDEYHLFQKATGWVLREIYKKEPMKVVDYIITKNKEKRLPKILLSYACEKMSSKEKSKCRE